MSLASSVPIVSLAHSLVTGMGNWRQKEGTPSGLLTTELMVFALMLAPPDGAAGGQKIPQRVKWRFPFQNGAQFKRMNWQPMVRIMAVAGLLLSIPC
jgi:hypothetical protein